MSAPAWTDNHCHLPDDPAAAELVVAGARDAGVLRLIDVGCDLASSTATVAAAARHDGVWATVGVHPHDARTVIDPETGAVDLSAIERLLDEPDVVAVGECGLDHHYDHSPRDQQRAVFAAQIALAHAHGLALVIHTREAWSDTFAILEAEGVPPRTVFHCFTGGPEEARQGLDLGIHLSFSGIVTYKSAPELREAAELCPLDRLLVETDSPYLAPPGVPRYKPLPTGPEGETTAGFEGRRNSPEWVRITAEWLAERRGESPDSIGSGLVAAYDATFRRQPLRRRP